MKRLHIILWNQVRFGLYMKLDMYKLIKSTNQNNTSIFLSPRLNKAKFNLLKSLEYIFLKYPALKFNQLELMFDQFR